MTGTPSTVSCLSRLRQNGIFDWSRAHVPVLARDDRHLIAAGAQRPCERQDQVVAGLVVSLKKLVENRDSAWRGVPTG